jgi:hypothetical protein
VKVRPKCPAGTRPSAGGYLTTDDDYRVDVFRPQNRRWLFELRYYVGSPEVKAYAVCRPV